MWGRQRKGAGLAGEQPVEAQPPCRGAGMLKGAQPPRSGSANHRAWAPEPGMGLVQLPAHRVGSALAVLLRFASVGLVREYPNAGWSRAGLCLVLPSWKSQFPCSLGSFSSCTSGCIPELSSLHP